MMWRGRFPAPTNTRCGATDSSGHFIANITGLVAGNSVALESLETTFQQDLNGDDDRYSLGSRSKRTAFAHSLMYEISFCNGVRRSKKTVPGYCTVNTGPLQSEAMSNFSFTTIDVPAAAGTYVYISVNGVDSRGEAVGNYGNVDGEGDGTFT